MTREEAVVKQSTEWWKTATAEEIMEFQINEERLCCPWAVFQDAVEECLGRPVWTHEFAKPENLIAEKAGKREFEGPIESLVNVLADIRPKKNYLGVGCSRGGA